jgi:uracil phosphoribosyltransferase
MIVVFVSLITSSETEELAKKATIMRARHCGARRFRFSIKRRA